MSTCPGKTIYKYRSDSFHFTTNKTIWDTIMMFFIKIYIYTTGTSIWFVLYARQINDLSNMDRIATTLHLP